LIAPSQIPYGAWIPYEGHDAAILVALLIAVGAAFACVGTRLQNPIAVRRPGRTVSCIMIAIWLLAIYTFLVAIAAYGVQLKETHLIFVRPTVHIGTLPMAVATFFVILYLTRTFGWKVALASAFVGTAAAPMIFEFPFDLIVMNRIYPPVPPAPLLYRELFFFPLFIVEFSTISLLTLLPPMRITKGSVCALAGMFAIFAVWAMFGFAYPGEPLPRALNVISKMLCFVAAVLLFVPESAEPVTRKT
jgi:hypothetical protein